MCRFLTLYFTGQLVFSICTPTLAVDGDLINRAVQVRSAIEVRERQISDDLARLLASLSDAIDEITPDTFKGEQRALSTLKQLVPIMRQRSEAVVSSHERLESSLALYTQELDAAQPVFIELAEAFRSKGEEKTYEDIKSDYRLVASIFERLAEKISLREEALPRAAQVVRDNTPYVKETAEFLRDLESALIAIPDFAAGEWTEQFLKSLQEYIHAFETLRGALRKFNERLIGQEMSMRSPKELTPAPSFGDWNVAVAAIPGGKSEKRGWPAFLLRIGSFVAGGWITLGAVVLSLETMGGWINRSRCEKAR